MDIENAITASDILKAREIVQFLKKHRLISNHQEEEILKVIQEKENREMWFITKPFRYNDGQSKTAYQFMKHMIYKLKIMDKE
jgi:hypothetical protein